MFQDWFTQEVLPSIRKTGKYAPADHDREAMPLPMDIAEAVATALGQLAETNAKIVEIMQAMNVPQASQIGHLE